jgi:CTP synthase (UTP-ammonia lyase)
VLGIVDADSAENDSGSQHCVVTPLYCALPRGPNDPPTLHDLHPIRLLPGSRLQTIYGVEVIEAGHFCNYGVNPEYVPRFEAAGMRLTAFGDSGDVRGMELPEHRFYVITLFHPQLESRPGQPSPFVNAFVNAARARAKD